MIMRDAMSRSGSISSRLYKSFDYSWMAYFEARMVCTWLDNCVSCSQCSAQIHIEWWSQSRLSLVNWGPTIIIQIKLAKTLSTVHCHHSPPTPQYYVLWHCLPLPSLRLCAVKGSSYNRILGKNYQYEFAT